MTDRTLPQFRHMRDDSSRIPVEALPPSPIPLNPSMCKGERGGEKCLGTTSGRIFGETLPRANEKRSPSSLISPTIG